MNTCIHIYEYTAGWILSGEQLYSIDIDVDIDGVCVVCVVCVCFVSLCVCVCVCGVRVCVCVCVYVPLDSMWRAASGGRVRTSNNLSSSRSYTVYLQ